MSSSPDHTKRLESNYNGFIHRFVYLLTKRVVWNIKQESFDEKRWEMTFRKLYKNMFIVEKFKDTTTKFSGILKELADLLGITEDEDWTIDSLSRMSSVSISRFKRKTSETSVTKREDHSLTMIREDDSPLNASIHQPKKLWPTRKPVRRETKEMTFGKSQEPPVKILKPPVPKFPRPIKQNKDINHSFTEPQTLSSDIKPEEKVLTEVNESAKAVKTEIPKFIPKPQIQKKTELAPVKRRANTPQLYYNGNFDSLFILDAAKRKERASKPNPYAITTTTTTNDDKWRTGISFNPEATSESLNRNNESFSSYAHSNTGQFQFNSVNPTPASILDDSRDFKSTKQLRGRTANQAQIFLKPTAEIGSGKTKLNSKRSSGESQSNQSRSPKPWEPTESESVNKALPNIQSIKKVYGNLFIEGVNPGI